ncbi:TPA: prepilin peptidase [Clostridioides difficile]|nr:prepilin peptidase [Clostridioides difficile]
MFIKKIIDFFISFIYYPRSNEKVKLNKKNIVVLFVIEILLYYFLKLRFDENISIIKGLLYFQVLIYTSYIDYKVYLIPNKIHIIIIFISIIDINLLSSIKGLFLFPLPYYLIAFIFGGIGGGDIKLLASSGFLIGYKGYYTLLPFFISFILEIVINYNKLRNCKNLKIALAPYLSVGCFLAYFI